MLVLDSAVLLVALIGGLYQFSASFFLAKRTLPDVRSDCGEARSLLREWLFPGADGVDVATERALDVAAVGNGSDSDATSFSKCCWTGGRRQVDSVAILLVDALRFDFCLYDLPESVGARLQRQRQSEQQQHRDKNATTGTRTRLFRFVADPPTVTMQRLKALTTGGLPTFADLSFNFGGGTVEDDTWIDQLLRMNERRMRERSKSKSETAPSTNIGFVGDDTWVDLFPDAFGQYSYPYPSFNTRDLDTVDDGCFKHLPDLVGKLKTTRRKMITSTGDLVYGGEEQHGELDVAIVHFLGVDHVGHTYGPHNEHMDAKLKQMDGALTYVLDEMDRHGEEVGSCHATLVFGDHGMTEDGNHGGGTLEEVSAALFVQLSPGCQPMTSSKTLLEQRYDSVSRGGFGSCG